MKNACQPLELIVHHQLLYSSFERNIGIRRGKMGTVILFFQYAHYMDDRLYEDFAGELLDEICNNITLETAWGFDDGLVGIGWGIEYLVQQKFIEGNTDEILLDIDKKIMEKDIQRIDDLSFQTGFEGLAFYVLARLLSSRDNGIPFDAIYLSGIKRKCVGSLEFAGEGMKLLLDFMQGKNIQYPFSSVLDKIMNEGNMKKEELSWNAGLKLLLK